MPGARKLQTQTESFWFEEYEVSEADLDLVASIILEAGKPQHLSSLAVAIIARRFRREKEAVARQAKSGLVYQPMGQYAVGQQVVFSALEFVMGRVVAVRPGRNPKYGPFDIIRVVFEETGVEREFAAGFTAPHPLNRPTEELLGGADAGIGEEDLVHLYGPHVERRLDLALAKHPDYVRFNGQWFLQALLPEIHVGYLNLAEAAIYEAKRPLPARDMLQHLDLASQGSEEQQLFALNHALGQDQRFDNISLTTDPLWYLRALEPAAAFARPAVLKPAFRAAGGEFLGLTMLDLVDEVGDELDDLGSPSAIETVNIVCELPFPHLYAGTLPLTSRLLRHLPTSIHARISVVLLDARTGRRFEAWALPAEQYICGLSEWYTSVDMCIGGQAVITPLSESQTFNLAITPVRMRRPDWVSSALVENGRLSLQKRKATIALKCDRNMLLDVPERQAILQVMAANEQAQVRLGELVRVAFEEQAKLSSRSVVHIKSLYSTANLLRRIGMVPVCAELTRCACFDPVGDGFWAYDASLEGVSYSNAEEMRERPRSNRQDLIKDQVVQYASR